MNTSIYLLKEAVHPALQERIKTGAVFGCPTDTLYGLAANACNDQAVERVFTIKQRDRQQPLPILVHALAAIESYVYLTEPARNIAAAFWPGAVTMIVPLKENHPLSTHVVANKKTVGVRVPGHAGLLTLLETLDIPLVGTSANLTGQPETTSAQEVQEALGGAIDFVIDGGPCQKAMASTIIDLTGENPRVLREGAIPTERLLQVIAA